MHIYGVPVDSDIVTVMAVYMEYHTDRYQNLRNVSSHMIAWTQVTVEMCALENNYLQSRLVAVGRGKLLGLTDGSVLPI